MKDSGKKTEVNDLISLVESEEWKKGGIGRSREAMVYELYDRLKAAKRFVPPEEGEVELFMAMELQHWPSSPSVASYAATEARKFVNFYQSKGWMVGKNKMKDWHAAVRGWLARNLPKTPPQSPSSQKPKSDDSRLF